VSEDDEISISEKAKDQLRVKNAMNIATQLGISEWLSVDEKKLLGTVKSIPEREDILPDINENLVVEFYSK
jgi:small subunit ribosomal protein S4